MNRGILTVNIVVPQAGHDDHILPKRFFHPPHHHPVQLVDFCRSTRNLRIDIVPRIIARPYKICYIEIVWVSMRTSQTKGTNQDSNLQTTKSTLSAHSCFSQSNVVLTRDIGASQSLFCIINRFISSWTGLTAANEAIGKLPASELTKQPFPISQQLPAHHRRRLHL